MAVTPFRERGFVETVRSAVGCVRARRREEDEGFDRRFGTDTERHLSWQALAAEGADVPPLWRYWPTLGAPFRRLMDEAGIPHRELTFVDLGSGKGRALLMASDYPFHRIVGVELSPALHRVAQENVRLYHAPSQRCFAFDLLCADASCWTPPADDLVVYLFQPFPRETLSRVLRNLDRQRRRRLYVAYMNPLFHDEVMAHGRFCVHARGEPEGPGEFAWTVYRSLA
jgi:hypothetical protein